MKGETAERWRRLCEEAAVEQDPERLLMLTQEINVLLEKKEQRLKGNGARANRKADGQSAA